MPSRIDEAGHTKAFDYPVATGGKAEMFSSAGGTDKTSAYLSSLPILAVVYRFFYLPTANLPIYHNLPISTDFFADLPNFNFDTECSAILFVISCKLCSHKCYFHVLMVKSASPYNKYYL